MFMYIVGVFNKRILHIYAKLQLLDFRVSEYFGEQFKYGLGQL